MASSFRSTAPGASRTALAPLPLVGLFRLWGEAFRPAAGVLAAGRREVFGGTAGASRGMALLSGTEEVEDG
jgi:hypothetical protein